MQSGAMGAFVDREEVLPVLHIRGGPDQLDLAEALQVRGYTVQMQGDAGNRLSQTRDYRRSVCPSRGLAQTASQHRREWLN